MKKGLLLLAGLGLSGLSQAQSSTMAAEKAALLKSIAETQEYTPAQMQELSAIFGQSSFLGQGNPSATQHPVSREQCRKERAELFQQAKRNPACPAPYMSPIPQKNGTACIDQFEFPNIPCEYPVVWVRASEAAAICRAVGKRLCDASEWENACANRDAGDRYIYGKEGEAVALSHQRQRKELNHSRSKIWAYGDKLNAGICAGHSQKSPGCDQALSSGKGVWEHCGSNTYPAGYYPQCHSSAGVYDQHGNAAEHMNLPLRPEQRTAAGGSGYTEMKGSWFISAKLMPHDDDCYWRAPYWHGTELKSAQSHRNYHLGFRCCS